MPKFGELAVACSPSFPERLRSFNFLIDRLVLIKTMLPVASLSIWRKGDCLRGKSSSARSSTLEFNDLVVVRSSSIFELWRLNQTALVWMMFVVNLLPCREPEFFSCRDADTSRSASTMVVYEEDRIAHSSSFFNRWSSIELGCFTSVMLETATLVAGAESLSGKRGCGGKISFSMVKFAKKTGGAAVQNVHGTVDRQTLTC